MIIIHYFFTFFKRESEFFYNIFLLFKEDDKFYEKRYMLQRNWYCARYTL